MFTQALSAEDETEINIHLETSEIKALIRELSKASEKNWERLRTSPSQNHYVGAKPVSYTHLDVYKRQAPTPRPLTATISSAIARCCLA